MGGFVQAAFLALYFTAVGKWIVRGSAHHTGLYAAVADVQAGIFGSYGFKLTFALCFLLALLPLLALASASPFLPGGGRLAKPLRSSPAQPREGAGPLTGGQKAAAWLLRGAIVLALAFVVFSAVFYAGPSRWVAHALEREAGMRSIALALLVPAALILLVPAVLAGRLGVIGMAFGGPRPDGPAETPAASSRRLSHATAAYGLLFLVAGAAAIAAIQWPAARPAPATLAVAAGPAALPDADRVTVTAVRRTAYGVTLSHSRNSVTTAKTAYIPLTHEGWKAGDPVHFVLEEPAYRSYGTSGGGVKAATTVRLQDAVMEPNALPTLVRTGFRNDGLMLADPVYVVQENGWSIRDQMLWAVAGGGMALGLGFLAGAFSYWRQGRRALVPSRA